MDANEPQDPTQVLGEAPTQVLSEAAPPVPHASARGKVPLIALIVFAGLLLIAVGVIVGLLFSGGGQSEPLPEPTISESPEPEPEPEPAALAEIVFFEATAATVDCKDEKSGTTAKVMLRWSVVDAERIALARGTGQVDALAEPSVEDLRAEESGFTALSFDCTQTSLVYTLTAANVEDERTSATVTIDRHLLPPPIAKPKITELAWYDGLDYAICTSFTLGETEPKDIRWSTSPNVNSVSVYIAHDNDNPPTASSDFTIVRKGLAASGLYTVTIDCGHPQDRSRYFAVKIVAENASGRVEKIITGNTAS